MRKVGMALVVIQEACRTRPVDPNSEPPEPESPTGLGFEASSKDLLTKLDNMQTQVNRAVLTIGIANVVRRAYTVPKYAITAAL